MIKYYQSHSLLQQYYFSAILKKILTTIHSSSHSWICILSLSLLFFFKSLSYPTWSVWIQTHQEHTENSSQVFPSLQRAMWSLVSSSKARRPVPCLPKENVRSWGGSTQPRGKDTWQLSSATAPNTSKMTFLLLKGLNQKWQNEGRRN